MDGDHVQLIKNTRCLLCGHCQELQGHVLEVTMSPHGNFVMQKCIDLLPADALDFIFDELLLSVVQLAKNRSGAWGGDSQMVLLPAAVVVASVAASAAAAVAATGWLVAGLLAGISWEVCGDVKGGAPRQGVASSSV